MGKLQMILDTDTHSISVTPGPVNSVETISSSHSEKLPAELKSSFPTVFWGERIRMGMGKIIGRTDSYEHRVSLTEGTILVCAPLHVVGQVPIVCERSHSRKGKGTE